MADIAPRYIILDLADVKDNLGAHWNPSQRDEYMAACTVCLELLPQTVDECPYCNIPVIWRNSKCWKGLYGNPATVEKLLSVYPPDPDDNIGQALMRAAGVTGFANLTELKRWNRARRYLEPSHLLHIIGYCKRKTYKRGILVFALNIIDKDVRSSRKPVRPRATQQEVNV